MCRANIGKVNFVIVRVQLQKEEELITQQRQRMFPRSVSAVPLPPLYRVGSSRQTLASRTSWSLNHHAIEIAPTTFVVPSRVQLSGSNLRPVSCRRVRDIV